MSEAPYLRVLIYREDDEWIAHLLEMDLVGTGATPEKAQADLLKAIEAQLSFCFEQKTDPFFPAPKELFEAWEQIQHEGLKQFVQAKGSKTPADRRATIVTPTRSARRKDGWTVQACA